MIFPSIKNKFAGINTPLGIAEREGYTEIVNLLKKHLRTSRKKSGRSSQIDAGPPAMPPPPLPPSLSLAELRSSSIDKSSEGTGLSDVSLTPITPRRVSLATAASQGDVDLVVEVLQNIDIDINQHDKDGFTPLHRAAAQPNSHLVVQTLIENGADLHLTDTFGDTALHWAAFCGHYESVKVLMQNGALATVTNHDGKTPLEAAMEEDKHEIVQYLKNVEKNKFDAQQTKKKNRAMREKLKVKTKEGLIKKTRWPQRLCVLDQKRKELTIFPTTSAFAGKNLSTPFNKFVYVRENAVKKVGMRFELGTINGTVLSFVAPTPESASKWISALRHAGGKNMRAIVIQRQYRRHRVRKKYKGKLKSRKLGAKLLYTASTFSETLQKAIEGTLSKKDDIKHGRVARLFRKRYFVLSPETGILTYYDNKAKRMLNLKGKKGKNRDIPINKFLSVTASAKRGGCHFQLLLTSGRIYELNASNKATARKWVNALRASLPAENYAAYKIQSVIRMMLIRRKFQVAIKKHRQMLKEAADAKKAAEEARKAEEAKKKISAEELKKQKEERRLKRLERLKRLQEVQDAQKKAVDDAKQEKKSKSSTMVERMKRLKALKAAQAKKQREKAEAAAKKKAEEEQNANNEEEEEGGERDTNMGIYNRSNLW